MKKFDLDNFTILPHHILVAETSQPDYEMGRKILLELNYNQYVLVEGWHCSCYDFDDSEWDAIEYNEEELRKLASTDYNKYSDFWKQVREQID